MVNRGLDTQSNRNEEEMAVNHKALAASPGQTSSLRQKWVESAEERITEPRKKIRSFRRLMMKQRQI